MAKLLTLIIFAALETFGADKPPKFFVWDIGTAIGAMDTGDYIMNLNAPCTSEDFVIHFPGFKKSRILGFLNKIQYKADRNIVNELLKEYGHLQNLGGKQVDFLDTFKGSGNALFVLLPEIHRINETCDVECDTKNIRTELTTANFLVKLAKEAIKKNAKVVNVREGDREGDWKVTSINLDGKSVEEQYVELIRGGRIAPFTIVSNIFREEIFSGYLNDPVLMYSNVIVNLPQFEIGENSRELRKRFAYAYEEADASPINEKKFEAAVAYLNSLSKENLERFKSTACVTLGEEMAERAISYMESRRSRLVFLGFGVNHYYEISEILKKKNISYISAVGKPENPKVF